MVVVGQKIADQVVIDAGHREVRGDQELRRAASSIRVGQCDRETREPRRDCLCGADRGRGLEAVASVDGTGREDVGDAGGLRPSRCYRRRSRPVRPRRRGVCVEATVEHGVAPGGESSTTVPSMQSVALANQAFQMSPRPSPRSLPVPPLRSWRMPRTASASSVSRLMIGKERSSVMPGPPSLPSRSRTCAPATTSR